MPVMSKPTKIIDLDEAREEARRFAFYEEWEARRFAFYEEWEEAEQQGMDECYQRVIADEQRNEQFARLLQAAGIPADDEHAVERLQERGLVKIDDNGTVAFRALGPRRIEGDK
jgi:hypothetical protein